MTATGKSRWGPQAAGFSIALLFHTGLLLVNLGTVSNVPKPKKLHPRTVTLIRQPKARATKEPNADAELPPAPHSPVANPRTTQSEQSITDPALKDAAPGVGPRRRDLFPKALLSIPPSGVPDPPTPNAGQQAARRLEQWRAQWSDAERERIKERTAELADLEQRLQSWFEPPSNAMREAGLREIPWHESLPKIKLPYFDRSVWKQIASRIEGIDSRSMPPEALQLPPPILLCVVGCGENRKAALEAVVEIFHDPQGLPKTWEIAESSGTPIFDHAALRAIDDTLRLHPGRMFRDPERTPEWTRWQFAATGYWWRWGELALNPTFIPPGRTRHEMGGFGGRATVAREVKLLDARYWPQMLP